MNPSPFLLLAFGIGVIAGLRALTAPAVVSWAATLHWIHVRDTHFAWMGTIAAVVIFTIAALAEIVNDKLPKTGPRTALPSVIVRIITGGLAGAVICTAAGVQVWAGVIVGAIGALVGTFGGYQVRRKAVTALHWPDFVIALIEDAVAVCGGLLLASRL